MCSFISDKWEGKKGKGNRPDLISVVKKKHLIQSEEGAILISE